MKHWEHIEIVSALEYQKYSDHGTVLHTKENLPSNIAVYVQCVTGGKRLEGIYDSKVRGIRPLNCKTGNSVPPNKDLRLYVDATRNEEITMVAVDGLMGTGKTSTCVEQVIRQYLKDIKVPKNMSQWDWKPDPDAHKVLIAKPHVNAGGRTEQYGHLPGDIDDKLDPTLNNFIQYFDRWHKDGFGPLREAGYIDVLPLGFIRGLDAKNMTIIADECQNTKELISIATRKADNCRIFFLGDTSTFQIDLEGNTPRDNGLTRLIELLQGAPYFQYIEMKSLEHIVRSDEVRDIVRRLFKTYGQNPQDWLQDQ